METDIEEERANGVVSIPPKVESSTRRMFPSRVWRMMLLILSSAVGGWMAYDVLTRFPHGLGTYLLAISAFLLSVEMVGPLVWMAYLSARAITRAATRWFGNLRKPAWNARGKTPKPGGDARRPLPRSRSRS